jgi:hypothetical protein
MNKLFAIIFLPAFFVGYISAAEQHRAAQVEHSQPTASFVPPKGCVEDKELATALKAVQACVQRFSTTHEFMVTLREFRLRSTTEKATENISAMAVAEHIAKLRAVNEGQPGQTLALFDVLDIRPKRRPTGADHCSWVSSVVIDRRVPGYKGEEFRIWAQTLVCARADTSDNSVQMVELRSSERFRVKTDRFKERFEVFAPAMSASEAEASLKMY